MNLSIDERGRRNARPGNERRTDPTTVIDHLTFLAEAATDLNSSLDLDRVFQKIARRVGALVDSHLFCVMLWNERKQRLEHSYSLKFGHHVIQEGSFALGEGLTGTAALERRPVRVGDVTRDPRYVRFRHAEIDIRSELAIPLVVRERLVGVLDLESLEQDSFTADHERLLTALASHVATALENARLYGQMVRLEARHSRELAIARQIQNSLLPDRVPEVPGLEIGAAFAPARELAGDFYDYLPYTDGCAAFAVGDVAGKATGAALYAAMAVGLLRGHAMEHPYSPAEMLGHLNEHLVRVRAESRFLALALAVYDPPSRTLIYGGAAFAWPRLVREGRVRVIEESGLPLGLFEDAEYSEVRVVLQPGDVVVIGSDGLEDCLLERGDGLTEKDLDRWAGSLAGHSAQDIADELIRMTDPLAETDVRPADDRTVLVLKAV